MISGGSGGSGNPGSGGVSGGNPNGGSATGGNSGSGGSPPITGGKSSGCASEVGDARRPSSALLGALFAAIGLGLRRSRVRHARRAARGDESGARR